MQVFSVLLPVYKNDLYKNFLLSVKSIYNDQSIKPTEIVIVRDGPVSNEIQNYLEFLKKKEIFKIIELKKNSGLTKALNIGLKNTKYEIIARADADDICLKDRFKLQLKFIEKYDVVGSMIQEFNDKENCKVLKLPVEPTKKYATFQTPIWHPTVMYKKSIVKKVGYYENIYLFEDYLLWAKLFMKNASFYNINKVLVEHRMNNELFKRRSGFKLFVSEIKLQNKFLKIGFINYYQYVRNIFIRGIYRFFPVKLKQLLNKNNIKKKVFG